MGLRVWSRKEFLTKKKTKKKTWVDSTPSKLRLVYIAEIVNFCDSLVYNAEIVGNTLCILSRNLTDSPHISIYMFFQ